MGLFDSVINLTKNVTDIVVAPVEIAVDLTNAAVKPLADAANEVVEDTKEALDDKQH